MKIITTKDITRSGLDALFADALRFLEEDLGRWQEFKKSARHAIHYEHGVFELMPCADNAHYSYKYVNAHPGNPALGKLSIVALGMLADVATGYPQLVCDMTLLTAIRTAAMSALAAKHLAKPDSKVLGLIGTGAQSEFQVYAMRQMFNITTIRYYDHDVAAMQKFAQNMKDSGITLVACKDGEEVVQGVDILTTCICEKARVKLFDYASVKDNTHLFINAIGGDCPGKTELDIELVRNARIVVEFYEQTKYEGEIQHLEGEVAHDEIWEIVQGLKPGRRAEDGIILFDSVGFALADFSMMRMLHKREIGSETEILPQLENPKDLISLFKS
ncbi:MAG: ornithine cyclodeaminase [Candidatus Kaiserbacteria bacterium]|nr:ornithine cyclodeaminase [Candidatus Kaiserbacteria bacterium]